MRTSFKNLSVEIKKKFKPNKLLEIVMMGFEF